MYRKIAVLFVCLLVCGLVLTACGIEKKDSAKVRDMDYTVLQPEEVPDELKEVIEEKKEGDFKVTYTYGGYLYIARGFGMQETGGYSIQVKKLYLASNAVYFEAELTGPGKDEKPKEAVSYPYIVIKTEAVDENVVFE
ncbi:MAG TPA: protease complex subunit PrcB family protein [Candidatus Eubacterium avistercoris]|uniref:Protease complex subunit PrcB family protein n=1 Tax=Candidatus Eubacterium avistercoris TaxID=2838567 RepID=A0A9D2IHF4_9FIRM|nr:protease complex subunit PrcB family protein [Candidatus Eubacterium avistercoris]